MFAPERLQQVQRLGEALRLHVRAGRAETHFGIVGDGAAQARVVLLHGLRRFAQVQQGRCEPHLVLRGGRLLEGEPRLAHLALRVDGPGGGGHDGP